MAPRNRVEKHVKKDEPKQEPVCDGCEMGADALMARRAANMMKYGWIIDFVNGPEDEVPPMGANYHTHGLVEKYGHQDLQVVFPLPPNIAHGIFWSMVDLVAAGTKFEVGKKYKEVLRNYEVSFIETTECDRKVLRLILPDKEGNLAREAIAAPYVRQYENLVHD